MLNALLSFKFGRHVHFAFRLRLLAFQWFNWILHIGVCECMFNKVSSCLIWCDILAIKLGFLCWKALLCLKCTFSTPSKVVLTIRKQNQSTFNVELEMFMLCFGKMPTILRTSKHGGCLTLKSSHAPMTCIHATRAKSVWPISIIIENGMNAITAVIHQRSCCHH